MRRPSSAAAHRATSISPAAPSFASTVPCRRGIEVIEPGRAGEDGGGMHEVWLDELIEAS